MAIVYGPVVGTHDIYDSPIRYPGSAAVEYAGTTVGALGDVDGDGTPDLLVGSQVGNVYVVRSPYPAPMPLDAASTLVIDPTLGEPVWPDVDPIGDTDGDGVPEFAVTNGTDMLLFPGDLSGRLSTDAAATRITGPFYFLRAFLPGAGDVDGDGRDDVVVAGIGDRVGYLFNGPFDAVADVPFATITSADAVAFDGEVITGAGDLDRDGYADLVASSIGSQYTRGVVSLLMGPLSGDVAVEDSVAIEGVDPEWVRATAAGVGDVDGDGFGDVAISVSRTYGIPWGVHYEESVVIVSGAGL